MEQLPILIPVPLLVFSFIALLLGLWHKKLSFYTAVVGILIALIASILALIKVVKDGPLHYRLGGWAPPIGIEYVIDHLSAVMALLITFIGLIAVIYSYRSYLKEVPGREIPLYSLTLLLLAGLTGIVVTGDLFNLYVFLEIASLSAYALMAVGDQKAPVAVFRYIIMGTIGASFYLMGVGFIYFSTGSLNMADVAGLLPDLFTSRAILAAVVFIVIGLALKMALLPLHMWLPDVYTYAPSAVTSLIAPLMTKVGAYVLIRMMLSVFSPQYFSEQLPVSLIIGWLGAAAIIIGSVMAIAQKDFRRMLAYSSIAQIGYIALGIGLANPLGLIGGMLHIINHAFMKGCLFQVAGAIRYRIGIWDITKFSGLGRKMPWTMAAFVVGAISMVGIPPACGFFSKWYLVLGCVDAANWVFVAVILASSLLNAVYFFRIIEKAYTGKVDSSLPEAVKIQEAPASMLAPVLILATGIFVLGFANAYIVTYLLEPLVEGL